MKINGIKLKVNGWEEWNGNKTRGAKKPYWFALSNTILEDIEIQQLNDAEKVAWIYILSQASSQKKQQIFISFDHAERVCMIKQESILTTIQKLDYFGIVTEIDPPIEQALNKVCANAEQDLHSTNKQDKTITNKQSIAHSGECAKEKPVKKGFQLDPEVAEAMYQDYPKKKGKKRGMTRLKTICKSEHIQNNVWNAIWNYSRYCDETLKPFQYQKQFDSFLGEWEDWVSDEAVQSIIDMENSDNRKNHRR